MPDEVPVPVTNSLDTVVTLTKIERESLTVEEQKKRLKEAIEREQQFVNKIDKGYGRSAKWKGNRFTRWKNMQRQVEIASVKLWLLQNPEMKKRGVVIVREEKKSFDHYSEDAKAQLVEEPYVLIQAYKRLLKKRRLSDEECVIMQYLEENEQVEKMFIVQVNPAAVEKFEREMLQRVKETDLKGDGRHGAVESEHV